MMRKSDSMHRIKKERKTGRMRSAQVGKRMCALLLAGAMALSGAMSECCVALAENLTAEGVALAENMTAGVAAQGNEAAVPTDYFYARKEALEAIASEREIMALVYQCKTYDIKSDCSSSADTVATLGSGQTVFIDSIGISGNQAQPCLWGHVFFYVGENKTSGYIRMNYVAVSDQRFLAWKNETDMTLLLQNVTGGDSPQSGSDEDALVGDFETGRDVSGNDTIKEELPEDSLIGCDELLLETVPNDEEGETTEYLVGATTGMADIDQFPDSYRSQLLALKNAHPSWVFVRVDTGTDWNEAVSREGEAGRSLIYYNQPDATKAAQYDKSWYFASKEAIAYYMDPRNYLTESEIFAMEQLTYNASYHTMDAIDSVLTSTFMASSKGNAPKTEYTYSAIFWQVGSTLGVSPFHLASRVIQEQGVKGESAMISGTYPGYEGYYNYFNVGASGVGATQVIKNGLDYAKRHKWTDAYLSIDGGTSTISTSYITRGQDTVYLEKFNVIAGGFYSLYGHQYMQNIMAPWTEAQNTKKQYETAGALEQPFLFKIPVYNNMPEYTIDYPKGNTSFSLSIPDGYEASVYVNDSACKTTLMDDGSYYVEPLSSNGTRAAVYKRDAKGNITSSYLWKLTYSDNGYTIEAIGEIATVSIKKFTAADGVVKLTWKKQSDATGYIVYRNEDGGDFEKIWSGKKTSFSDKKATESGVVYRYYVRAYKNEEACQGSASAIKTTFELKKPKISSTSNTKNSVKLTWAKVAAVEGYYLYRKGATGGYKLVTTIKNSTLAATAKNVTYNDKKAAKTGGKFYYKLVVFKTIDGKLEKSPASAVITHVYLKRPQITKAVSNDEATKVTVSWKSVADATGYYVYRSMDGGSFKKIATTEKTKYVDSGYADAEETCSYKIVAYTKIKKKTYTSAASAVVEAE